MPYRRLIPLRRILSLMIALALLAAGPAGGAAIAQASGISRTVELYPWTGLPTAPAPSLSVEANEALLRVVFTNGSGGDIAMSEVDLVVTLPATPESLALAGTSGGGAKVSLASSSDPAIADAASAFTLAYSDADSTSPPGNASACTATPVFSETATDSENGTYATQRDRAVRHACLDGQTGYTWPADANLIVDIVLNAPGILFGVTDAEAGVLSGLSDDNTIFLVANQAGGLTPGYVAAAPNSQSDGALAARIGQAVGSVQDWSAGATTTARGATVPAGFPFPTFEAGDEQIAWPGLEITGGLGDGATPLHLPDLATAADNLTVILAGEYDVSDGSIPAGGLLISFTPDGQSTPDVFLVSRTQGAELQSVPDFAMIRSTNTDIPWNGLATGQWAQPFVLTLVAKAGSVPDLYWNGTWLANDAAPGDRLHIAQSLTEGALFGDNGGFNFSPPIRLGSVLVTSVDLDTSNLNTLVQAAAARVGATVESLAPPKLMQVRDSENVVLASVDAGGTNSRTMSTVSGLSLRVADEDGNALTPALSLEGTDSANFDIAQPNASGETVLSFKTGFVPMEGATYEVTLVLAAVNDPVANTYAHAQKVAFQIQPEAPANEAPVFTSTLFTDSSGYDLLPYQVANALHTFTASDQDGDTPLAFSLSGDDAAAFSIGESSGELSLSAASNTPVDANKDGVYEFSVTVTDSRGAYATMDVDAFLLYLPAQDTEKAVFSAAAPGFFYLPHSNTWTDPNCSSDNSCFSDVVDQSPTGAHGTSEAGRQPYVAIRSLGVSADIFAMDFTTRSGDQAYLDVGTEFSKTEATPLTAIFAIEPIATTAGQYLLDIENRRTVLAYHWEGKPGYYDGAWKLHDTPFTPADTNKRTIMTYRLGTDGEVWQDRGSLVSGSYTQGNVDRGTNNSGNVRIRSRYNSDSAAFNGYIYSVLVVADELDDATIDTLEAYAATRIGVQAPPSRVVVP